MASSQRSTITSKGQVTIPRAVRDELDLRAGDHLAWRVREDGTVEVRKEATQTLSSIVGILGRPTRSVSVEEMDEGIAARHRARHR